jgi:hypothetical protein
MPEMIPSSPPPEVHDAMVLAACACDALAAAGRQLSFRIDDATGKVIIEVNGAHGHVLFAVPPSKALELAGGGSLEYPAPGR